MSPEPVTVLWLRPSTGENVSVRRERIAAHLEQDCISVTIHDASGLDAIGAIIEAVSGDYDLIIGNVRIGLYLGYILSVILQKPFIGDVSDSITDIDHLPTPVYSTIRRFEWWVLGNADATFFVESKSFELAREKGLDPILARNAVDYQTFSRPPESTVQQTGTILERNGVSLDKPIAVYIGSMVPHYHLSEIVEAASIASEWEFVFVGEDRGAEIDSSVSGLDNAHFLGAFDYELMPGFLSHADASFCLVDKEQPLKILEYGAANLPTLAYPGKLTSTFSSDEVVFTDAEPAAIADSLERIATNPEWAAEIALNLQNRAKDHSWSAIADAYEAEIDRLVVK